MEETDLQNIENEEPEILNPYSRLYRNHKSETDFKSLFIRPKTATLDGKAKKYKVNIAKEKYDARKKLDKEMFERNFALKTAKYTTEGPDMNSSVTKENTNDNTNMKEWKRLLKIDRISKRVFSANTANLNQNFKMYGEDKSDIINSENEIYILKRPASSNAKLSKGTVYKADSLNIDSNNYKQINKKSNPNMTKKVNSNMYLQVSNQNPHGTYDKNRYSKFPSNVKSNILLNKQRSKVLQKSWTDNSFRNLTSNNFENKSSRPASHFLAYSQNVKHFITDFKKTKNVQINTIDQRDSQTKNRLKELKENVNYQENNFTKEEGIIPNPNNNKTITKLNQEIVNKYTTKGKINFKTQDDLPGDMIGNILKMNFCKELEKRDGKDLMTNYANFEKEKANKKFEKRRYLSSGSLENIIIKQPYSELKEQNLNNGNAQNIPDNSKLSSSNIKLSKIVATSELNSGQNKSSQVLNNINPNQN